LMKIASITMVLQMINPPLSSSSTKPPIILSSLAVPMRFLTSSSVKYDTFLLSFNVADLSQILIIRRSPIQFFVDSNLPNLIHYQPFEDANRFSRRPASTFLMVGSDTTSSISSKFKLREMEQELSIFSIIDYKYAWIQMI
jgi:hypothetical protein